MAKITFRQNNLSLEVKNETELLRIPELYCNAPLKFGCRRGHCAACVIIVLEGEENLSPKTKEETDTLSRLKRDPRDRLACQCCLKGDILIE